MTSHTPRPGEWRAAGSRNPGGQSAGPDGGRATTLLAQALAALGHFLSRSTGSTVGPPAQYSVWAAVTRLSLSVRHGARREERRRVHSALAACGVFDSPETRTLKSDSDTLVAAVSGRTGEFVLRTATSEAAGRRLTRHGETVSDLRERCDPAFAALLPRVLDLGEVGEQTVVRETLLPGQTSDASSERAAAAAITRLHMATARPVIVTPSLVGQWIDRPVSAVLGLDLDERHADEVDRMAGFLRECLMGRSVIVSCTHGDFWPGNVLVSDAHLRPVISGIVDWEDVMDPGLPDADPVHWYLSTRPVGLGSAVCRALDDPGSLVRHFDSAGICLPNPHLGTESVVMVAWLWQVANTLTRSTRNGPGRLWFARNVHPVLHRFRSDTPSFPGGSRARDA